MPEPNEPTGGGDVLSQSEVESLLAQVAQQDSGATVAQAADDAEDANAGKNSPQPYDFRHPIFLTAAELRRLRLRHEEFIRALSARLSIYMRLEFTIQMSNLQTVSYRKFTESLPNPAHLSLFKLEPLRGIGILAIPPRLGLTMVDRQLGGSALAVTGDHDFSEIEMALLDQAIQLVLGEWCSHWLPIQQLRPVLLGHENNGHFLQTAPHDTLLIVLTMEAKLGDCTEQMHLAVPCFTLEPLIRRLGQITDASPEEQNALPVRIQWNRNFDEVPVPVTAIWDHLVLTARDVANLKAGDILPLDPRCTRQVKLRLADLPRFEGQLGTTGGKWAVALTGRSKTS